MAQVLAFPHPDSAQRTEWRHQERADALARATEQWHYRLKAMVMCGLTGTESVSVPYRVFSCAGAGHVASDKLPEAVFDALNAFPVMEALMHLLAQSTDPLAAELRVRIGEQIAKDRATGLAEIEALSS